MAASFRLACSALTPSPHPKQKTSERINVSTGGSTLATFWKHLTMVPPQKAGVVLFVFLNLPGITEIHIN
jgi:hypothetical protein